jgi:O-antigen/teichoic acid export membrane protein
MPDELSGVFNKVLKIISALSLFTGFCAILSADFLIHFVFGLEFSDAKIVFQILAGYFSVTMINSVFSYTLIGIEREKTYTLSLFWGMLVFFAVIFATGTKFSATGAAAALFFYISTSLIIMARSLKSQIDFNFQRIIILPFIFTFGICLPLLLKFDFTLPVNLVIAFTICLPLISVLAGIGYAELRYIKDSLIWS